ncbi:hypothetical protein O6H91_Y315500 [Diphasiastrum complanatum]|nr:hypothetical protein O6H91_Y315500 [Diphasiastrum complanatum]
MLSHSLSLRISGLQDPFYGNVFLLENQVHVKLKVVAATTPGVIAKEAKRLCATWVVLDRHVKNEGRKCLEELHCNLVTVKPSGSQILRLSFGSQKRYQSAFVALNATSMAHDGKFLNSRFSQKTSINSPETGRSFTTCDACNPFETMGSPYQSSESGSYAGSEVSAVGVGELSVNSELEVNEQSPTSNQNACMQHLNGIIADGTFNEALKSGGAEKSSAAFSTMPAPQSMLNSIVKDSSDFHSLRSQTPKHMLTGGLVAAHEPLLDSRRSNCAFTKNASLLQTSTPQPKSETRSRQYRMDLEAGSKVQLHDYAQINLQQLLGVNREMESSCAEPAALPRLCSICEHRVSNVGKPPKGFSFAELEQATGGFSPKAFSAEGGFGSVYKGILPDGQTVAVKQKKVASTQGDNDFFLELEVLSCAQHRNVVKLIGYCIENSRRLLVYEFVCNGSLDVHLYDPNRPPLQWLARKNIAVGVARGLRYLHEECRISSFVQTDVRPSKILLTHDFEAMVGDFGLARWQSNSNQRVESQTIGTLGYLAPEYTQNGQLTYKADLYSFGVFLLELISGRKPIDHSGPEGLQRLTDWAFSLLEKQAYLDLVDPRLKGKVNSDELIQMLQAAYLCIQQDAQSRPNMSQVLCLLEGDLTTLNSSLSFTNSPIYYEPSFGRRPTNTPRKRFAIRQSEATNESPLKPTKSRGKTLLLSTEPLSEPSKMGLRHTLRTKAHNFVRGNNEFELI